MAGRLADTVVLSAEERVFLEAQAAAQGGAFRLSDRCRTTLVLCPGFSEQGRRRAAPACMNTRGGKWGRVFRAGPDRGADRSAPSRLLAHCVGHAGGQGDRAHAEQNAEIRHPHRGRSASMAAATGLLHTPPAASGPPSACSGTGAGRSSPRAHPFVVVKAQVHRRTLDGPARNRADRVARKLDVAFPGALGSRAAWLLPTTPGAAERRNAHLHPRRHDVAVRGARHCNRSGDNWENATSA